MPFVESPYQLSEDSLTKTTKERIEYGKKQNKTKNNIHDESTHLKINTKMPWVFFYLKKEKKEKEKKK